jgi:hypothetical protein
MGKLTVKEAEELKEKGILSNKAVAEMQKSGLVGTRKRGVRKYMKTANGSWVCPQLYFQGLNNSEYSKRMVEFRDEFNTLLSKYTTERSTIKR